MARRLPALLRRVAPYAGLCLAVLFALLPILWACSTALKPGREISAWPPHWIPDTVTLQNFERGVWSSKFLLYLRNTISMTVWRALSTSRGGESFQAQN